MNNRIGRFLEKVIMNNMNFFHVLKTNGVQTELQTDRQTDRQNNKQTESLVE